MNKKNRKCEIFLRIINTYNNLNIFITKPLKTRDCSTYVRNLKNASKIKSFFKRGPIVTKYKSEIFFTPRKIKNRKILTEFIEWKLYFICNKMFHCFWSITHTLHNLHNNKPKETIAKFIKHKYLTCGTSFQINHK